MGTKQAKLRDFDAANAPHIEAEARGSPWLRSYIASRRALPHDDFGTPARLADAMCYTDDAAMAAVGPRRAVLLLSLFHEMIGAPHGTIDWAASERISAFQLATGVTRLGQAGAIPRPLGLGPPFPTAQANASLQSTQQHSSRIRGVELLNRKTTWPHLQATTAPGSHGVQTVSAAVEVAIAKINSKR